MKTEKVCQEFYCGECRGYFMVNLNIAINHEVEILCPQCEHKHRRCIVDGTIFEQGRFATSSKEVIRPLKSTYAKDPLTKKMQDAAKGYGGRRDGIPVSPQMFDRWLEVAAREKGQTE
jgi:hypothetical protein